MGPTCGSSHPALHKVVGGESPEGPNTTTVRQSAQCEAIDTAWNAKSSDNRPMFSLCIQSVPSMYSEPGIYRRRFTFQST